MTDQAPVEPEVRDRGSALLLVLVLVVISAFVVLPLMRYTIAVNRSAGVEGDKARATELARGATLVALSDARGLFNSCPSAGFADSLDSVSTRCEVVASTKLLPDSEVPYSAAVVQADATLPPSIPTSAPFEISTSVYDSWLTTPGWTPASQIGKVWLPQLADRVVTNGNASRTTMTTDPTCELFFPGTYPNEVRIAGPAYFASGVYYFRDELILENGADVVVGNGTELGCTSDPFVVDAVSLPTPLNMSGYGATMVFGENGRLVVEDDDAGAGDISFVVNQRLVPAGDDTIAATERVSIVAVSGTHLPLVGTEAIGDDLLVDDVIAVPASTVDDDGDPSTIETTPTAEARGYSPSTHTPKPLPIAPVTIDSLLERKSTEGDGVVIVEWTDPNPTDIDTANGVRVVGYDVTAYDAADTDVATCSVTPGDGGALQDFCTFGALTIGQPYTFDVESIIEHHPVAGQAFDPVVSTRSATAEPLGSSPVVSHPDEPEDVEVDEEYTTGVEIEWDPPASNPDPAISHYIVTATPATPSGNPDVSCQAPWNETSCVLDPLVPAETYDISVNAVNRISESHEHPGILAGYTFTGTDPDPVPTVVTPALPVRMPEPIIDLRMGTSAAVRIDIAGYVSVPQGHVTIDAGPAGGGNKSVSMTGGLVAGQILLGAEPATTTLSFDNPIAQRTIRLISQTSGAYRARSEAIAQVNTSGSYAINSWFVQ